MSYRIAVLAALLAAACAPSVAAQEAFALTPSADTEAAEPVPALVLQDPLQLYSESAALPAPEVERERFGAGRGALLGAAVGAAVALAVVGAVGVSEGWGCPSEAGCVITPVGTALVLSAPLPLLGAGVGALAGSSR